MSDWIRIIEYLKSDACNDIHYIMDSAEGWAYITDCRGRRHKVTQEMPFYEVYNIIQNVKRRAHEKTIYTGG